MKLEYYKRRIDMLETLDALEAEVEEASFDDTITNAEYEEIYAYAMRKIMHA